MTHQSRIQVYNIWWCWLDLLLGCFLWHSCSRLFRQCWWSGAPLPHNFPRNYWQLGSSWSFEVWTNRFKLGCKSILTMSGQPWEVLCPVFTAIRCFCSYLWDRNWSSEGAGISSTFSSYRSNDLLVQKHIKRNASVRQPSRANDSWSCSPTWIWGISCTRICFSKGPDE